MNYEVLDVLFGRLEAAPEGSKSPLWIPTSKNIAFIDQNIFSSTEFIYAWSSTTRKPN